VPALLRPEQIDLGLSVPEDVDMGWRVIIREDDEAQPGDPQDGNHE
jgi:hypothetical protein